MDWIECKLKRFVKEVEKDINLINALLSSSKNKFQSNEKLILDEITASTKIIIIYDSLREVLEALAIKRGFKIYNHECFTGFLYEVCNDKVSSFEFDKFRRLRNQINYYVKKISLDDAKVILEQISLLRQRILNKYLLK